LTVGLKEFAGTVVVASHNRDLISGACDRIISLEGDGHKLYDGTLDEYLAARTT